jgi:hypothetical protein
LFCWSLVAGKGLTILKAHNIEGAQLLGGIYVETFPQPDSILLHFFSGSQVSVSGGQLLGVSNPGAVIADYQISNGKITMIRSNGDTVRFWFELASKDSLVLDICPPWAPCFASVCCIYFNRQN